MVHPQKSKAQVKTDMLDLSSIHWEISNIVVVSSPHQLPICGV